MAQLVKNLLAMQETWVQSLGWEDSLKKGKATHSSILVWRSPRGHKESVTERLSFSLSMYIASQFSSVAQSCPTLCDPMNRSTPGLPVHHQLPDFTQTHVHRVSDAIQTSPPLSSPSPPASNPPSIRVFSNKSTLRMR